MAKLQLIEAGRGIAALAVVAFHANAAAKYMGTATWAALKPLEHGVDFFFILSGFIICQVHRHDIGQPQSATDYGMKRFIRVFPVLWLVAGCWIVLQLAVGNSPSPEAVVSSLTLLPSDVQPLPFVVWTLRHEMIFYAAFLVLILHRTLGIGLFAFWTAGCLTHLGLAIAGRPFTGLPAFFFSSFQLDFLFGAAVAYAHQRYRFTPSVTPLLAGVALVAFVLSIGEIFGIRRAGTLDYSSLPATAWVVVIGIAFALVLHGLLRAEGLVRVPRALLTLGAASYAIYLIHTPFNSAGQRIAMHLPEPFSGIFLVLAGVGAGVGFHLMIEKPLTSALRARIPTTRRQVA